MEKIIVPANALVHVGGFPLRLERDTEMYGRTESWEEAKRYLSVAETEPIQFVGKEPAMPRSLRNLIVFEVAVLCAALLIVLLVKLS